MTDHHSPECVTTHGEPVMKTKWYCGECGVARPNGCACNARDVATRSAELTANAAGLSDETHDATIDDDCDCETCRHRRDVKRQRDEHIDKMSGPARNSHADDCLCTPCSTRRLHQEETAMNNNDLDDTVDLPGYRHARNARRPKLEPIPVEEINYAELSAFGGDDELTANGANTDAEGLVVNEAAPGGLPVIGLDYTTMSKYRPRR